MSAYKAPPVRYAKAGDVNIAYRVMGEGPLDVVWVPGMFSNLEVEFENPLRVAFFERLTSFCRLTLFDKRGVGLSDRNVGAPSIEERMDDVRAVMDAVGSERAALVGTSEGGPISIVFAATYPERTTALVLFGTLARARRDIDYPYGLDETIAQLYRIYDGAWGTGESLSVYAPHLYHDEGARERVGRMERAQGSPGTMRAFLDTLLNIDVRSVLPMLTLPTLVIHGTDDAAVPIANGRWLAEHIAGARFVEIPGNHAEVDPEDFVAEVEPFLTGKQAQPRTDRVLATVLFTDIVSSTEHTVSVGDRRWRELLDAHDRVIDQQLERFRGRKVNPTGDGVLATFDGPARAVACGCELRDRMRSLGLDIRAGLHTGEVEVRGEDVTGIAVVVGRRVSDVAGAGEVLVSRTVTDLVAGSGIEFADHGTYQLKGVPGDWQLFEVTSV
jgi:class 3 adenylate cyclase/alpha-beta hydrolase superfamily lysophospholipase